VTVPSEFFDALRRMQRMIDEAPPPVRRLRAHHSVPYGTAWKQWNTRGELEVWVNRGWVADLPRAPSERYDAPGALMRMTGIPVVLE
jgi:hypothetical protein